MQGSQLGHNGFGWHCSRGVKPPVEEERRLEDNRETEMVRSKYPLPYWKPCMFDVHDEKSRNDATNATGLHVQS